MALKVLLEMRPALDGYSGIPQETRLLFRGLAGMPEVAVEGLLQSGNLVLEKGLPLARDGSTPVALTPAEKIDRLSNVVVSLQQGAASHRFEHLRKRLLKLAGPLGAAVGSVWGRQVPLTRFEPEHFQDYVWRAMFAKTLPVDDFSVVVSRPHRVLRWPWSVANAWGVASASLGHALYPRLDTRGVDLLIAETPYPGRVARGTAMVVRYHDAIPLTMPHTIKDRGYHRALHFHALRRNAADGAWFACVSDATRADLLAVLPEVEPRTVTIPNMVSHHFQAEAQPAERVPEIIWSRKNRLAPLEGGAPVAPSELTAGGLQYLLMVSTIEPRKNHTTLVDAWELLRATTHPRLHLVCVGGLGWEHQAIISRFKPWLQRGGLHLLADVPAEDLRLLYRHAAVTVCPSLGEGFDFAGIESMCSGGVVASSDIPVHREVYGNASAYFSPYSAADMARVVGALIGENGQEHRAALRQRGADVGQRYRPERVLPQWEAFLQSVAASRRA
jgi:glycosyltransferase involved in cell wall biosynthesis